MRTLWPSPAKLNLFLYITGQRADGYHHLQTLFQFLDYGDQLEIIPNETGDVVLVNRLPGVRKQDNLIYRAAIMLKQQAQQDKRLPASAGAMLKVNKKLPMGGGLGGGSSNAATTLLVLNHLWATSYRLSQLAEMGLSLGADIPVFIHGFSALAEGIGEQLQPAFPNEKWYLVAHPGVSISTQDLFSDPELIRNTPVRSLDMLMKSDWHNDCEPVARKRFRKVEELLLWLLEYAPSRLTGTGACVFAEFNSEAAARQILAIAPEGIRAFVARGKNISPLHQCLPK